MSRSPGVSLRLIAALLCGASLLIALRSIARAQPAGDSDTAIRIVERELSPAILDYWKQLPEGRPALPGYRAPILANAAAHWPGSLPVPDAPENMRRAAQHVAERLAIDGLLPTLVRAIGIIGPVEFNRGEDQDADLLRRVGIPVDLLEYFPVPGASDVERYPIVREILRRLMTGMTSDAIHPALGSLPMAFRKSAPGFLAATDSGDSRISMMRLQLPRGDFWRGIGDGSGLDVARQLSAAAPDASFILSVERSHLASLLGFVRQWSPRRPGRWTIIVEEFAVAQWAQDNGRPGVIITASDGSQRPATLVPRFANRGEEGTILVPGETFLLEGLAASGHVVVQSPLLFQGGNLLLAADPDNGWRYLLIGEAEIYRNMALGLSREQVIGAFKVEFDADIVEVLPAVSYHIDYEVSLRVRDGGITAFVNDTKAALSIVLRLGVRTLQSAGVMKEQLAAEALARLDRGDLAGCSDLIRPALDSAAASPGRFPESLAERFGGGVADSGVGNFQRFLLAADLASPGALSGSALIDPAYEEYLLSFQRRDTDRAVLWKSLERLRFKVVLIPGMAEEDLSLNYLNGLHTPDSYFMPAAGGYFTPLDEAAATAFKAELGASVSVVPINSGESQRRLGAVRCAVAAYPEAVHRRPD